MESELLKPRYKVISDYPGNIVKVDSICTPSEQESILYYEKYPDIFKKLEWWEDRVLAEMPEYVIVDKPCPLSDIPKGTIKIAYWGVDSYGRLQCDVRPGLFKHDKLFRLLPGTRTQYLNSRTPQAKPPAPSSGGDLKTVSVCITPIEARMIGDVIMDSLFSEISKTRATSFDDWRESEKFRFYMMQQYYEAGEVAHFFDVHLGQMQTYFSKIRRTPRHRVESSKT